MNKEQYNDIIDNTLHTYSVEVSVSNLSTVKTILNKMGIPLPSGDLQEIFSILQTNNYMAWRLCTLQDAQTFANQGTAVIGISRDRISIFKETDTQNLKANNEAIISIDESTNIYSVSDMLFYNYTAMRTSGNQYGYDGWSFLDAAMDYYGRDYTYTYCGGYYNYYYTYSDGSRMYFRVQ